VSRPPQSNFFYSINYQTWETAGLPYKANPKENGVFGINHLNKKLVELAKVCGFKDPNKNTAHSKRKFAITSLVSAKEEIGHQNIKTAARHKSDDAHRQYQRSAAALHDRLLRALWAGGNKDEKGSHFFVFCDFVIL
jgi:hypothetical protein